MTADAVLRQDEVLVTLPDDGDPLDIAPEALKNIQKNWFTFSVAAYRIHHEELYKQRGFDNFKDYVDAELDIKYRVAMMRVEMGEAIEMLNLSMDEVGEMGWTKFKYIAPLLKKDMKRKDLLALLRKAERMPVSEIKDYVAEVQTQTKVVGTKTRVSFTLTNEQGAVWNEALEKAKGMAATDSEGVAAEFMAITFIMHADGINPEAVAKKLSPEPEAVEKPRRKPSQTKAAKAKAKAAKAPAKKAKKKAKKK